MPLGHRATTFESRVRTQAAIVARVLLHGVHAVLHHNALLFEQQTIGFRAHAMAQRWIWLFGSGTLSLGPTMCGRRRQNPASAALPFLHGCSRSFPLASLSCFVFVLLTVPVSADLRLLQREQVIHQFRPCVPFQLACKLAASEQLGAPAEAHGMQCPHHVGVRRGCCVGSCSAAASWRACCGIRFIAKWWLLLRRGWCLPGFFAFHIPLPVCVGRVPLLCPHS